MSLNIAQIKRLLEQIGIGTEFIFNPSLTESDRNVFNNWENLITQQQQLSNIGIPTTIFFDIPPGVPFNIPQLDITYSFNSTTFQGGLVSVINWPSETIFSSFPLNNRNITQIFNNTVNPVFEMTENTLINLEDSILQNNGTVEIIRGDDITIALVINGKNFTSFKTGVATIEVLNIIGLALIQFQGNDNFSIEPNTLRILQPVQLEKFSPQASISSTQNGAFFQVNINDLSVGTVTQDEQITNPNFESGITIVPFDDTPPTQAEGNAFPTSLTINFPEQVPITNLTFTTKFSCQLYLSSSEANANIIVFLHDNLGSGVALHTVNFTSGSAGSIIPVGFEIELPNQATDQDVQYTIRAGIDVTGTIKINGNQSGRLFGGTMVSYFRIQRLVVK